MESDLEASKSKLTLNQNQANYHFWQTQTHWVASLKNFHKISFYFKYLVSFKLDVKVLKAHFTNHSSNG